MIHGRLILGTNDPDEIVALGGAIKDAHYRLACWRTLSEVDEARRDALARLIERYEAALARSK